jgi:hypothetical protein
VCACEEVRDSGAGWEAGSPSDCAVICCSEGGEDVVGSCPLGWRGPKHFGEDEGEDEVTGNVG